MTSPSSSLRLKFRRGRFFFLFRFLAGFFLLILGFNFCATFYVNHKLRAWQRQTASDQRLSFRARFGYFNILRGLTVFDAVFLKEGTPFFEAGRLDLGFDGLSIFSKKIRVKNVVCAQGRASIARIAGVVPGLLEMVGSMDKAVQVYDTTRWRLEDFAIDQKVTLDADGYFSHVQNRLFIARGRARLREIRIGFLSSLPFFSQGPFLEPFDIIVEAERYDQGYRLTRLQANSPYLKLTGAGQVILTSGASRVDARIDTGLIRLEELSALHPSVGEHARGSVRLVWKLFGPPENLRSTLEAQIEKVSFSLGSVVKLEGASGRLFLTQGYLVGHGIDLTVNRWPLSADFSISIERRPSFLVQVASRARLHEAPAFLLSASGVLSEDYSLLGRARGRWSYSAKDMEGAWTFRLNGARFDPKSAMLRAGEFGARFALGLPKSPAPQKGFDRSFSLKDFYGVFEAKDNGLWLRSVTGSAYGGSVEGEALFWGDASSSQVKAEAHVRDVDVRQLGVVSLPQGKLEADFRFDTSLTDALKGQIFVTNGIIAQNGILNAVSEFLGVKALQQIAFGDLSMFLNGNRQELATQVKLRSSLVNGLLDARIISYDKIDGYLSLDLATELLNESKIFRKILIYLEHDEPSVIFPFRISSYITSPRVLWLKNEFKDKLTDLLPERNKRALQAQVSQLVESMGEE